MKFPELELNEVIAVVWDDTQSDPAWRDKKQLSQLVPAEIKSVGFFHRLTKRALTIKHNLGKDGVADATVIPRGCIKRIKHLTIKEK